MELNIKLWLYDLEPMNCEMTYDRAELLDFCGCFREPLKTLYGNTPSIVPPTTTSPARSMIPQ